MVEVPPGDLAAERPLSRIQVVSGLAAGIPGALTPGGILGGPADESRGPG